MLEKMGKSLRVARIVDLTGIDNERRARRVEFRIRHQQHAQAIVERKAAKYGRVRGCRQACGKICNRRRCGLQINGSANQQQGQ